MIIGIEINDGGYSNKDLSSPHLGNPGIGGAMYVLLLLAYEYSQYHKENNIIVFHENKSCKLPEHLQCVILNQEMSVITENHVDVYIATGRSRNDEWYNFFQENGIKLILRMSNYPTVEKIKQYTNYDCIKRIVFQTGQQYDRYLDDEIINIGTVVENMHPRVPQNGERRCWENNIVTFMGALLPQKGFHVLASQWKHIKRWVPNAELYVIGSGKLYDVNEKLGKYELTTESYEKQFINYLLDDDGNIDSSVHFMGTLGAEKKKILQQTKVGVVNPSAATEVFCNSAIEMQCMGIPIVTVDDINYYDILVKQKSALLFKSRKQMRKMIVQLLQNDNENLNMGLYGAENVKKYEPEHILPKWDKMLTEVENDERPKYLGPHGYWWKNQKWRIIINRFLRIQLKLYTIKPIYARKTFKKRWRDAKKVLKKILKNS